MSTTEAPVRGKRIRMATYTCDVGERQIVGQRVDGEVRLYDEPARDGGRRWVIERGVESRAELEGDRRRLPAEGREDRLHPDDRLVLKGTAISSGEEPRLSDRSSFARPRAPGVLSHASARDR